MVGVTGRERTIEHAEGAPTYSTLPIPDSSDCAPRTDRRKPRGTTGRRQADRPCSPPTGCRRDSAPGRTPRRPTHLLSDHIATSSTSSGTSPRKRTRCSPAFARRWNGRWSSSGLQPRSLSEFPYRDFRDPGPDHLPEEKQGHGGLAVAVSVTASVPYFSSRDPVLSFAGSPLRALRDNFRHPFSFPELSPPSVPFI